MPVSYEQLRHYISIQVDSKGNTVMRIPEKVVKLPAVDLGVLDRCALIELKCAELYRHFERVHADIPEMAALWRKSALEEDNHAEQFKFAERLKGAGMEGVKSDISRIDTILQTLESYLDKIAHSQPTPIEGLQFAIHLEEVLSEYHMTNVVEFADNDLARLFKSMMDHDKGHIDSLKNALALMVRGEGA